jgi:hypothetical protein
MDLDQVLETFEVKRQRFWEKLFKVGKKKKGALTYRLALVGFLGLMMKWKASSGCRWSLSSSAMARTRYSVHQEPRVPCFIDDVISAMRQMGVWDDSRSASLTSSEWWSTKRTFFSVRMLSHLRSVSDIQE